MKKPVARRHTVSASHAATSLRSQSMLSTMRSAVVTSAATISRSCRGHDKSTTPTATTTCPTKPEESDEEEVADENNEIESRKLCEVRLFGCAMRALVVLFVVYASCVLASERERRIHMLFATL